ncbi:MAG TPA: DUF2975 domain-containing protein [Candidatus Coproplasma excrementipullorum]|nr:DUF2975 domain-containing protein [Candidatus Coproplasma excrementipullorum]
MKKFRYCGEAVLALFAVACIIFAVCGPQGQSTFEIMSAPFVSAGDFIRVISLGGNIAGGWCLYIFIGILPLIFPIVKTIIKRKVYFGWLLWAALCAYTFIMLYILINLHLLRNEIFTAQEEYNAVYLQAIVHGACIIWYALALLCVLFECAGLLKAKSGSSYVFAQIILYVIAALYIFLAFYGSVVAAANDIAAVNEATLGNINVPLNIFAAVFSVIMDVLPSVATVILLCICARFIRDLKRDNFSPERVDELNKIIALSKISIIVTLSATIINNIVQLALSKWLLNVGFSLKVSLSSLSVVCLVIIAAGVLKRAIEANEENKLTI